MSTKDLIAFGRRLKELRQARGLTQAQLAGQNYTHAYISSIEAGKRQPTRPTLAYLAHQLGLELDELLPPAWIEDLARHVARGNIEARKLFERSLDSLEADGQVSARALEFAHRELAKSSAHSGDAQRHLRAALGLHEKRSGAPIEKARLFIMLGDCLRATSLNEASSIATPQRRSSCSNGLHRNRTSPFAMGAH
jgi:transcriptional regulator with XRE-family HTH domain